MLSDLEEIEAFPHPAAHLTRQERSILRCWDSAFAWWQAANVQNAASGQTSVHVMHFIVSPPTGAVSPASQAIEVIALLGLRRPAPLTAKPATLVLPKGRH
jgi:hypothetical protein